MNLNISSRIKKFFESPKKKKQDYYKHVYQELFAHNKAFFPGALLQRAAQLYSKTIALICDDEQLTYSQLYKRAAALTQKLSAMGIGVNDRVCLLFENSIEYYIAYFGIWQTGAVIVPLNTFFKERELEHVVTDCKPALIIVSTSLQEHINQVNQSIPVLTEHDFPAATETDITIPDVDQDRMIALLYTSGTTGLAKGVMLSSKNIATNIAQLAAEIDLYVSDRLYSILPLFHSFAQNGAIWSSFFMGLTVIVIPKVDKRSILKGLTHKPTIMIGVPAFYGLLCLLKTAPVSQVRYFISGGDALPDKIRSAFAMIYRRKICNGYGLTETSPFVCAYVTDELVPADLIGYPACGLEVRFVDESGMSVMKGEVGVMHVKGDNVMLGYYNAPEQTAKVLSAEGWLNTGDFAKMDEQGRISLAGRQKDLIIHKGFNIYPQEVENVLMSHPLVMRAAVVGKPDADTGEIPIAFVSVRQKKETLEKELKQLCLENLATYKLPKKFIVLDDMPLTATAKVNKPVLKKEHLNKI